MKDLNVAWAICSKVSIRNAEENLFALWKNESETEDLSPVVGSGTLIGPIGGWSEPTGIELPGQSWG